MILQYMEWVLIAKFRLYPDWSIVFWNGLLGEYFAYEFNFYYCNLNVGCCESLLGLAEEGRREHQLWYLVG